MGIGDFISDVFGSTNESNRRGTAAAPQVDRNAYNYGGTAGGANEAAGRYQQQGNYAQARTGEQVNYQGAQDNAIRGLEARQNELYARQGQQNVANLAMARAQGQVPSVAQMQAQRDANTLAAQQSSAAASARGAAGMALAQQNAAANTAQGQSAISNQAQMNVLNERERAEGAAMQNYTAMRGGDAGMRQGDLQSQQQQAQQAQYQAGLNQQQRAANDQFQLGMTQAEMGVRGQQLAGAMNREAQQSSNTLTQNQINAGVAGQNANTNQANAMGVVNMVAGAASSGAVAPPKAAGGPIGGRSPYLVGERGPEIIVPDHNGMVIPAEQTRRLLQDAKPKAEGGTFGYEPQATWAAAPQETKTQAIDAAKEAAEAGALQDRFNQRLQTVNDVTAYQKSPNAQTGVMFDQPGYKRYDYGQEDPYLRDVREVAAVRRMSPDLVNEDDVNRERRGLAMARQPANAPKPAAEQQKPAEQKPAAEAKKGKVQGAIDAVKEASKAGMNVDTSYHGPSGGMGGPSLVALPTTPQLVGRALGGPVQAGGAPMPGPFGGLHGTADPMQAPSSMGSAMASPMSGTFDSLQGGGMNVGGSLARHSKFGTQFIGNPVARADGGPVQAGGAPAELLYEPPGQQLRMNESGHGGYYASQPTEIQQMTGGASLSGPSPSYASAPQAKAPPPSGGLAKARKKEPDYDAMLKELEAGQARIMASLNAGPAVRTK